MGTLDTNQEIERAYIGITETQVFADFAPDHEGGFDSTRPRSITIKLTIGNFGHTPGDLLGGYWGWSIGSEPDMTRSGHFSPAFLR